MNNAAHFGRWQVRSRTRSHPPAPTSFFVPIALLTAVSLLASGCGSKDVVTPGSPTAATEERPAENTPEDKSPQEKPDKAAAGDPDQSQDREPASDAGSDELGELKVRFEFGGDPPKPAKLNLPAGQFCGQFVHADEKLLVHPGNKGVQNVVVYVYTGRGGSKLPEVKRDGVTVTLANQSCRFEPHILISQKGDTLRVTNPDPVGHNANLNFFNNKPENPTIPAGQEKSFPLVESEPAPIPIDCNIHPWMKAYLLVLDHRFAGISDDSGELSIQGLPVGQTLVFRAFHEAGKIAEVTVGGEAAEWKRSRFEVDIQAGMNDLGTVVLPAESFRVN